MRFADTDILLYSISMVPDGQDYGGVRVVNPFRQVPAT